MIIKFKYTKNGKRAYRFSQQGRWFPIKMEKAELLIANGKAQVVSEDIL